MTDEKAYHLRPCCTELDHILGHRFDLLDDGFIRVLDYMGSDDSVVQAARVSYGAGTKQVSEDRALIRYLLRNQHTSPFEMCEIKMHIRVPMDCWRQWIRHRTASINEYSTRYSVAIDRARIVAPDEWRTQSQDNKQGSAEPLPADVGETLSQRETDLQLMAREVYNERLEHGVARELARKDLPLSTYTEAYWKIDLHNLLHFLRLRMHHHAQYEIRQYAKVIGEQIVSRWVPHTWEAFQDYRMDQMSLSRMEQEALALLSKGQTDEAVEKLQDWGWLKAKDDRLKPGREAQEFAAKLEQLDIEIPW